MAGSLSQLSNVGLVEHGDRAVVEEHSSGVRILEILVELERRSLHLEQGYSSLFDYCTRRWRYSSSKAGRYIAAARAMVRHPELRRLLEEAQLTICGAARIAAALDAGDSDELLRSVAGKTYAEIDGLVAKRKVAPRIPDRIRPVGVRVVAATTGVSSDAPDLLPGVLPGSDSASRPGSAAAPGSAPGSGSLASGRTPAEVPSRSSGANSQHGSDPTPTESSEEEGYEIRFFAGREFVEKLERAKAVCSVRGDLESVLGAALDQLLERRDPDRREARRVKRLLRREKGKETATQALPGAAQGSIGPGVSATRGDVIEVDESSPTEAKSPTCGGSSGRVDRCPQTQTQTQTTPTTPTTPTPTMPTSTTPTPTSSQTSRRKSTQSRPGSHRPRSRHPRSRHIPARTRDAVFARDGGCCSYVGSGGVRCGSRSFLQIDHVQPFSLGGEHDVDNLRLLCGRHNRLEADRVLGKEVTLGVGYGAESPSPGELPT